MGVLVGMCEREDDFDVEGVSEIAGVALAATGDFDSDVVGVGVGVGDAEGSEPGDVVVDGVPDAAGVPDGVPLREDEIAGVPEEDGVPEGVADAVTTICDGEIAESEGVGVTVKTSGVGESDETVGVADAAKEKVASEVAFGASGAAEGVAHASTGGQRAPPPVTFVTFDVAS